VPPIVYPSGERTGPTRSHAFIPPAPAGWDSIALAEWELVGQEWEDQHPHDEFNYVLEGTLFVSCDEETVEAPAGSVVYVPAEATGRYWAPERARMLAIYGPNPHGRPTRIGGLRAL
jgi:mannose-6-phosphate isomerase-like protein (cupin superfamily)